MRGTVVTITSESRNALRIAVDHIFSNFNEDHAKITLASNCTIRMRTQTTPRRTILPDETPTAVVPKITITVKSPAIANFEMIENNMYLVF